MAPSRRPALQCALYWKPAHRESGRTHEEAGLTIESDVDVEETEVEETIASDAPSLAPADAAEYAHDLIDVLVDRQASDVVLLDLSRLAAFADFFVIATADNIRQARALVDSVDVAAREHNENATVEGSADEGWILIDAGNGVIVHLFSVESRLYYNLEGLWRRAQEVVRIQ